MLDKYNVIKQMSTHKLTAVIRGESYTNAAKTAEACIHAGLNIVEVTFTVEKADQLIQELTSVHQQVIVGAGTVLDSETARIAILSGAQFIVGPNFDRNTAMICNRYGIPYIPGCMTVNEITAALDYGVDIVKLFPSSLFQPSFIKEINAPFPQVKIMPTGGITLHNITDWLRAGAVMIGIGGAITGPAKNGDYVKVEQLAADFKKVLEAWDSVG